MLVCIADLGGVESEKSELSVHGTTICTGQINDNTRVLHLNTFRGLRNVIIYDAV